MKILPLQTFRLIMEFNNIQSFTREVSHGLMHKAQIYLDPVFDNVIYIIRRDHFDFLELNCHFFR